MISAILDFLVNFTVGVIGATGYTGVFFLMFFESAGIPIPSEVIMPFAGFLVNAGRFGLWQIVLLGAFGNLAGSLLAYWIGARGGRPFLEKYGRYILISKYDLDLADRWFARYGEWVVFFGRLLPVIRTYISFPAGVARMNITTFSLYTFLGALPWCLLFGWLGVKMGSRWEIIREALHNFDVAIALLVFAAISWYVWRHLKHRRHPL